MTSADPTAYLIAGPNGAGKTTFATEFLPDFVHCREFVNADLIAAGLSAVRPRDPGHPGRSAGSDPHQGTGRGPAGLRLRDDAGRSGLRQADRRPEGSAYHVVLFFLWLPDADMAVARVANRVRQGGHDIPEATIRRRFEAGLRNFFRMYARSWTPGTCMMDLGAALSPTPPTGPFTFISPSRTG